MVLNVSLDLLTGAVNVAAVSAGGTHIVGAPFDAIGTAVVVRDDCKIGNAPILLDGRILIRLLCRANQLNGVLGRAKVVSVVASNVTMTPIETRGTLSGAEVVVAATRSVKLFEKGTPFFGTENVLQGAMDGSRHAILLQAAGGSDSSGSQDGAEKESKGHGKELHG
jgi:hypothetical protein